MSSQSITYETCQYSVNNSCHSFSVLREIAMSEDQESPDFSHLPDVIWVRTFNYLPLADQRNLASTCHALHDVFNHPSLWSSQTIYIIGQEDNWTRGSSFGASHYLQLAKRYGKYFQNLTIIILGHLQQLSPQWERLFTEVGEQCRLESLTLELGRLTSRPFHLYGFAPKRTAVKAIISFVKNAFRMRHVHVRSWPMFQEIYDNPECNIFQAMMSNPKMKDLESLSVFMMDKKETEWSERRPILLSPTATTALVTHFSYLTYLGLRSPMITQELIEELAEPTRTRMKIFGIFVHYLSPQKYPGFGIPSVPSSSWTKLIQRCPELQVELTIFLRVSHLDLANMIKPEVPVTSLTFMKYSGIDPFILNSMYTIHHKTFTKFYSYCDSKEIDNELIEMVTKCKDLNEFVYYGDISVTTVTAIVEAAGARLQKFVVLEKNIQIPDQVEADDDEVIRMNEAGELVMVEFLKFHQSEDLRQEQLAEMRKRVSECLGYDWSPA